MKRLIYICIALTAVSCGYDDMRLQKPEELGTDKDEYVLDAQGGCAEISVYSNMEGEAFFAEPAAWAGIDNPHFVSDQIIGLREHRPSSYGCTCAQHCSPQRHRTHQAERSE